MRYTFTNNQLVKFYITSSGGKPIVGRGIIVGCANTPQPVIGSNYIIKPLEFEEGSITIPSEDYPFECFCVFENQIIPEPRFIK